MMNERSELMEFKLFLYIIIIFSAVLHEFFHGWTANYLGDPTAKYAGRLTLNPLKHLDMFGTVILPLFLLFFSGAFIGWAKPVPYNPYNLRDQKWGSAKVAIAGPAANFSLALIFSLVLRFLPAEGFPLIFYIPVSWIVYTNILLGVFNLLPFPPLDGSTILMSFFPQKAELFFRIRAIGIFLALMTAIYILSPFAHLIYKLLVGIRFIPYVF